MPIIMADMRICMMYPVTAWRSPMFSPPLSTRLPPL